MPLSITYPTDANSLFDRLMSSPEADISRKETLAKMSHETPERAFPDVKFVQVSSGK